MEMGIIGLPQSGKSSLFEIMTKIRSRDVHGETCVRGQASVPDKRFDRLVDIFHPAKVSPAKAPFVDVHAEGEKAWETVRQTLSGADGLLHIVDGFSAADLPEMVERWRRLEDELILSDLMVVENRRERLQRVPQKALKPAELLQVELMPRLQTQLEQGKPLRDLSLTSEERHILRSFSFWSLRPELVVLNVTEERLGTAAAFQKEAGLTDHVIAICGELEGEMAGLSPEEQQEFLVALNMTEPAFVRIIQAAFRLLGRITYFTVGEDEVKAWVIPAGAKAPRAAAAIHKDFERGFIKAEVIGYEEFIPCGGTMAAAKAAGKLRLEGKDYVVQDGDIISLPLQRIGGRPMTLENKLIPILREGIHLIKMVLFKTVRNGLAARCPHPERTFVNQLTGAMINELFCTPNHEEPFLSFAVTNRSRIEEEMKRIADDFPELKIPLTDALRVQFLCDSQEGVDNPVLLTQARELGILIMDRDTPLPDNFMTLARSLGEGSAVTHQAHIGSA